VPDKASREAERAARRQRMIERSESKPSGSYRPWIAAGVRGASGLVPGGPWGALAGGAGEVGAELIEGKSPKDLNWAQVGTQTALGAVPFGKAASVGRGLAKGAVMGGVGAVATQQADRGLHIPDRRDLPGIAIGTGMGGAGGAVSGYLSRLGLDREKIPTPDPTNRPAPPSTVTDGVIPHGPAEPPTLDQVRRATLAELREYRANPDSFTPQRAQALGDNLTKHVGTPNALEAAREIYTKVGASKGKPLDTVERMFDDAADVSDDQHFKQAVAEQPWNRVKQPERSPGLSGYQAEKLRQTGIGSVDEVGNRGKYFNRAEEEQPVAPVEKVKPQKKMKFGQQKQKVKDVKTKNFGEQVAEPEVVTPPVVAPKAPQMSPVGIPDVADPSRPYAKVSDSDVKFLSEQGDQAAAKELALRRPTLAGRLKDDTGAVGDVAGARAGRAELSPEDTLKALREGIDPEVAKKWFRDKKGRDPYFNDDDPVGLMMKEMFSTTKIKKPADTTNDHFSAIGHAFDELPFGAKEGEEVPFSDALRIRAAKYGLEPPPGSTLLREMMRQSDDPNKAHWYELGGLAEKRPPLSQRLMDETGEVSWGAPKRPLEEGADLPAQGSLLKSEKNYPGFAPQFRDWVNGRRASKVEGLLKKGEFKDLDEKGIDGIFEFQKGMRDGRYKDVGSYFDAKHDEAQNAGIHLGFKENYLPQLWDNSAEEVFEAGRKLGLKPKFALPSILENYEKGIAFGLKPKFQSISDLVGWYEQTANKAIADRQFFDHLQNEGLILPKSKAPANGSWASLDPDHFPIQKFQAKGKEFQGVLMAPKDVADTVNNYLREPQNRVLDWTANASSISKNYAMSSGIPGTGINAHGFNIMARNVMARGLKGGAEMAKYMVSPKSASKELAKQLPTAPQAMKNGLTLSVEGFEMGEKNLQNMVKNIGLKGKFADNALMDFHMKYFEKPLFHEIIPALKLKHYNSMLQS
jgi:hypothetical protein